MIKTLLCAFVLFGVVAAGPFSPSTNAAARFEKLRRWMKQAPKQLPPLSSEHHIAHTLLPVNLYNDDRKLQDGSTYEPIRIRFLTEPLDAIRPTESSENQARIDAIKNTILPMIESTWTKHLSVVPADNPIPISAGICFGDFIPFQQELAGYIQNGVENADLVIIVKTGVDESVDNSLCGGTTLAYAFPCLPLEQSLDRPIVGEITFCLNEEIDPNDPDSLFDSALVAVHEMTHVLAFNVLLYPYYRDEMGQPRTPRNSQGQVEPRVVTCLDGTQREEVFPSESVLQLSTTSPGLSNQEILHYEVVTPRVTSVVRNLFDCQSLTGARLENAATNQVACVGVHWDERIMFTELMSAIAHSPGDGQGLVLSPLTLALLEDSGWYRVTYQDVDLSPFGLGLGCDFVNGDCIVNDQVPDYGKDIFCDTVDTGSFNDPVYCDPTHTAFGWCDLFDATSPSTPVEKPADAVQYFTNPNLFSVFGKHWDYCPLPVFSTGLDIDCTDEDAVPTDPYDGEVFGPTSRCVNAAYQTADGGFNSYPGCWPIECDDVNYRVVVNGISCEFDGQEHQISGSIPGKFECPRLSIVCPHLASCPAACSGRGACKYDTTPPVCECSDSANTSPSCAASETSPGPGPTPPPTPQPTPASSAATSNRSFTLLLAVSAGTMIGFVLVA